ncbi:aldehyde dehydrogenase family protein [Aromatoleum toluolicum]|uniref:Aldehyde dehydrogenase family protein n=1 Tax=Aromatoleum toluolicum TaxID=90060 RepID=A0ABX1NJN4_9RHOO|nr:aldehyde dehydrogenase family protein [Aromatoleum toluolicum]NMF99536.1 aldehyde dehydrogenase family protein [Aromatoleum toluolicum]
MEAYETVNGLSREARDFIGKRDHRMLVGGLWVDSGSGRTLDVINPATEEVISRVPAGDAKDVDLAVQAASCAFESGSWPKMTPMDRERLLLRLADLVEQNAQAMAEIESIDNGKPATIAKAVDVTLSIAFLRYMAGWATKIEGSTVDVSVPFVPGGSFNAYTRREPVGVVAAIVAWNFPLMLACWKLGPALATGCTVVLKPAEQTPLSALYLGKLIEEAGYPPGVVNIVTGDGISAGAPLTTHPLVNKITFTGSTEVGKLIGKAAMDNMARVTLELGGKSPVIVLDDCDPVVAAAGAANAIFFNQGQTCCAGSRLYVPKRQFDRVVSGIADAANALKIGPGLEAATQLGPLVSREQMERVCNYIDIGRQQGAEIVAGGARAGEKGYFVKPTVIIGAHQTTRVVQEEIFGPVLVALPYDDLDEVAARANDTPYGLGASIWSNDLSKVHQLIPKIKAGTVWVNCHNVLDPAVPFGGFKLSGFGREMGKAALDAYLETKSVVMAI